MTIFKFVGDDFRRLEHRNRHRFFDAQISLRVFPVAIPVFGGAGGVEILHPARQFSAVIARSDPLPGFGLNPVGGISSEACGKNGGAILERNSEDA